MNDWSPVEIGVRVLLVVDLDADAELRRERGGSLAEQRGVLGEGLVPGVGVRDAADRDHDPDPAALEVVDDVGVMPRGTPLSVPASVVWFSSLAGGRS